jgi:acetyl esterase/lipase
MKSRILTFAAACLFAATASAQTFPSARAPVGPPQNAKALPLYGAKNPGKVSDEMKLGHSEVRNVTYPTLTPVLPKPGTANGTAVIVAPGGGFMFLSMESEGWAVAKALADRGVTAFVLKYRLNPTPKDEKLYAANLFKLIMNAGDPNRGPLKFNNTEAGQDALAALKLVRTRAKDWGINPSRVGMIGFSAGAITTLRAVLDAGTDNDPTTLAPDFFGYIYGPMDKVEVPANAPPMFAALAMDDTMFSRGGYDIVGAWRDAKRPVELHVYQNGGHGFGLGNPGATNSMMMPQFLAWMDMQGLLKSKP